jgi:transposase
MPTIPRRPAAQQQRQRLEARRLRAAELFATGVGQAEVARRLGVSAQAVSVWHARWQAGGTDGLRSKGPSGPAPRLSDPQLATVERALLAGATANGFTGELWTVERVALVIERLTGVGHHPAPRVGAAAPPAAALCYGVRGGDAQLCFHVTPDNYDTDRLVEVLEGLRRFLGGEQATLLWDGLPAHRSRAMRE